MVREVERAADRLYLIGHDPATGRPRLGPRQLGLGLAAALVGELLIGGLVEVRDEVVRATARQPVLRRVRHHSGGLAIMGWCLESHRAVAPEAAGEPCSWCGIDGVEVYPDRMVWDRRELIAREHAPRPLLDWLTVLAMDAATLVAQRLAGDDWLTAEYRRSLWSGRLVCTWVPANVVEADGARQALRRIARHLDPHPGVPERLVIGLVDAVQLTRVLIADLPDPADATRVLSGMVAGLDGSLRLLVEQTRAAADNAVMTHTG